MNFQDAFEELDGFVHYLAGTQQRPDDVLMSADELISELYEEMVKGFQYYNHLPEGQLLAVLRKMMDNRIAELVHRYFNTHRGLGVHAESLSADLDDDVEGSINAFSIEAEISVVIGTKISIDPHILLESRERVSQTREILSDEAKQVFDVIMESDPLLMQHVKLSGMRASFVYKGRGTIKVQDWHVADTLQIDTNEVREYFTEIKLAYEEICEND